MDMLELEMSNVQVTTVTLSQAGIAMLMLDNEKHENAKTINRLQNEIAEKQRRLRSLKKRQEEIALAEFQANQLTLPGMQ
jgi:sensor histidine kinase YesM